MKLLLCIGKKKTEVLRKHQGISKTISSEMCGLSLGYYVSLANLSPQSLRPTHCSEVMLYFKEGFWDLKMDGLVLG